MDGQVEENWDKQGDGIKGPACVDTQVAEKWDKVADENDTSCIDIKGLDVKTPDVKVLQSRK